MTDPIRAALERLIARLDETTDPNGPVPAWSDSFYAARAALSADGPAVPESREPASVVEQPSDAELRDIWETGHLPSSEELANDDGEQDLQFLFTSAYHRWLEENPDAREEHENKCIRAVFNAGRRWGHQPAPPAEGEVGELVAWLRMQGEAQKPGPNSLLSDRTKDERHAAGTKLTRAADLLAQRHPAPVPVASDFYFEFVVSDADYCTQAGGIAPTYAQALSEGQNYLAQYLQDGPHTLELRRVEVLSLPSGEVEHG